MLNYAKNIIDIIQEQIGISFTGRRSIHAGNKTYNLD